MKPLVFAAGITLITLLVWAASPSQAQTKLVIYQAVSNQPDNPTMVYYQGTGGDQVYDALNWGNSDGDTLPWVLTAHDVGTPYLLVQNHSLGLPWPTLTCDIIVNGVVVAHDSGINSVTCEVKR